MKGFLTAAERLGSFEEIRRNLAEGVTPMLATGLSQIHKVHFAWALTGGSRLVLTPDEPAAVRMAEDLNRFYGEEKAVVFPTREFSFREVEGVSREYEFARLRVLESLAWGEEMVVVASAEAALQRTIPPETLRQHCTTLTAGQTIKEIQDETGRYVGCLEELGLQEGWITADHVHKIGDELSMTLYGKYLQCL